jgi:hypothetical protein
MNLVGPQFYLKNIRGMYVFSQNTENAVETITFIVAYCLTELDAMQSGRSLSTFQRQVLPPFSGHRSKPSKLAADMLASLLYPEDGGSIFH